MSECQHSRTEMLLGKAGAKRLSEAKVAVFGVGGVGGYAVEALARAGVGELLLVDHDTVSPSNINRQIIALHSTIGKAKVDVARERILDINPEAKVTSRPEFFSSENKDSFDLSGFDYVIDAIDSVRAKLDLIEKAKCEGARIISAMGAGNKLDATAFIVSDISKTEVCPLAKAVRTGLRRRGINHLKVVYSREEPIKALTEDGERAPGSISFVPSAMGLIIAGEVIKDIANDFSE